MGDQLIVCVFQYERLNGVLWCSCMMNTAMIQIKVRITPTDSTDNTANLTTNISIGANALGSLVVEETTVAVGRLPAWHRMRKDVAELIVHEIRVYRETIRRAASALRRMQTASTPANMQIIWNEVYQKWNGMSSAT